MAYISDLAKELNRTEGMVTKMLKTHGYLKKNGDPRKASIDAGLMREDRFIYKKGWNLFIEELGYKESVKKVKKVSKKHKEGLSELRCPICNTTKIFLHANDGYTCTSCGGVFIMDENKKLVSALANATEENIALLARQVPIVYDN